MATGGSSWLPTSPTMPSSSIQAMIRPQFGSSTRFGSTKSSRRTSTIRARHPTLPPRSPCSRAATVDDDDVQFAIGGLDDHELQWYAVQEIAFLLR